MKRWVGAVAAMAFGGAASAQTPPPALPFVLKQVGPGAYAAIDGPEHKAGSNAGFVIGDDGGPGGKLIGSDQLPCVRRRGAPLSAGTSQMCVEVGASVVR